MNELVDRGIKSPEDRSKFEKLDAEQQRLKDRIDQIERADELYKEMRTTGRPPMGELGGIVGPTELEDKQYRDSFNRYLKKGRSELSLTDRETLKLDLEYRDMGSGGEAAYPGATSGFFVPVGFVHAIETALKYYGPMNDGNIVTILPTDTGAPLPFPTSNDVTVEGELVSENAQVTGQDVSIGQIMFGSFKGSTKLVKISLELLEDSAFDLQAFLTRTFAERQGRLINRLCTVGSGSNEPNGVVTAAVAGNLKVMAVGAGTNDGTSGANTIGSDDLTALEHKVDVLYRPGARYMMHDSTLRSIKQIKDKYGRPLWQPGVAEKAPDTINGYEYAINNSMDSLQSSASSPTVTKNTVLFGALQKYVVRRVKSLSVLRLSERYADFGQVGFLGFFRFDGNLLDAGSHPIAVLQNIY
jgi:HK97 family phage major capsid protein